MCCVCQLVLLKKINDDDEDDDDDDDGLHEMKWNESAVFKVRLKTD